MKQFVLFTLLSILSTVSFATGFSREQADAYNTALAQKIATREWDEMRTSKEVFTWNGFGKRDGIPEYCYQNCDCIQRKLVVALQKHGFTVQALKMNPVSTVAGVQLRGAPEGILGGPSRYDFHFVTAVRLYSGWIIFDPISIRSMTPEKYEVWKTRLLTEVRFTPELK